MTHEQVLQHPGVLAGTHRIVRDGRRPGGYVTENIALRLASQARYIKTEKGREKKAASDARYESTEKGRAVKAAKGVRYNASEKGRITKVLKDMRYDNKLAEARDEALLHHLKERKSA